MKGVVDLNDALLCYTCHRYGPKLPALQMLQLRSMTQSTLNTTGAEHIWPAANVYFA